MPQTTKFDEQTLKAIAEVLRLAANKACPLCALHQTPAYRVNGGRLTAPSSMEWTHINTKCKAAAIHDTAADLEITI
jgi:hypothetical protein